MTRIDHTTLRNTSKTPSRDARGSAPDIALRGGVGALGFAPALTLRQIATHYAHFLQALAEGDHHLEKVARDELRQLGVWI